MLLRQNCQFGLTPALCSACNGARIMVIGGPKISNQRAVAGQVGKDHPSKAHSRHVVKWSQEIFKIFDINNNNN